MNPTLGIWFKGLTDKWSQLSFNQKVTLGTLLLAMVLSTFFIFQHTNDDYDILYDNLSLPDAAAAVEKLKGMHEPYRIAGEGHTILVPRPKKNELVLATASELQGENTINLAKIPPVLQGDIQREWIKKLNTQEISGILSSIQGIKKAQVIVSQPENSVFSDEQQPVTASVMLMTQPGFRLRDEQVKVIRNLVAHAVPGLTAENVAIADNSGNPLAGPSTGGTGQNDAEMRQKLFEDKITKKILAILTPVVGKENAVVSVTAALNFDQAEADINRVIPTGGDMTKPEGLAVSRQDDTEEYAGGEKPPTEGGAAGVQSNATPQYQGRTDKAGNNNNYKHSKTITNFTHSEEHKKVVYASGAVERMTVAVVLNKVLTAKETEEITQLVENAAGIDRSRGDSVDIKGFQFSAPIKSTEADLAQAAEAAQQQNFYLQLASIAAMVLLGLGALFIFHNLFKKSIPGELVEEQEEDDMLEAPMLPAMLENPIDRLPALEVKLDPEMEHMKTSLNTLVGDDPKEAARVLVTYMKEG